MMRLFMIRQLVVCVNEYSVWKIGPRKEIRMAVVAGLFDSDANATEAMDKLLREHIEDLDTKVINRGTDAADAQGPVPILPITGGMSGSSTPVFPAGVGVGGQGLNDPWMDDLDDVERAFYYEGMREGATLALAH